MQKKFEEVRTRQKQTANLLQQLNQDDDTPDNENLLRINAIAHQQLSCCNLSWHMVNGGIINGCLAVAFLSFCGVIVSPLHALITAIFFAAVGAIMVAQAVNNSKREIAVIHTKGPIAMVRETERIAQIIERQTKKIVNNRLLAQKVFRRQQETTELLNQLLNNN